MERIKLDRTTVVTPVIDTIDKSTFEMHGGDVILTRGIFSWSMTFTWMEYVHNEPCIAITILICVHNDSLPHTEAIKRKSPIDPVCTIDYMN